MTRGVVTGPDWCRVIANRGSIEILSVVVCNPGEHPSRRGNKILKWALFLSAFAALRDPVSRTYYDPKAAQGKRHNQALLASPDVDATSCLRCSATGRLRKPNINLVLDKPHRPPHIPRGLYPGRGRENRAGGASLCGYDRERPSWISTSIFIELFGM
jgi:hypothetical protein